MSSCVANKSAPIELDSNLSHVIVREGSERAEHLRQRGWRATLGWRSETGSGTVWMIRFEPAALPERGAGNQEARRESLATTLGVTEICGDEWRKPERGGGTRRPD